MCITRSSSRKGEAKDQLSAAIQRFLRVMMKIEVFLNKVMMLAVNKDFFLTEIVRERRLLVFAGKARNNVQTKRNGDFVAGKAAR